VSLDLSKHGPDLLNRQHACGDWTNLFFCGEGTVMGTGSPAVTISGVSAANMVLRSKKMQEYRWKVPVKDVVQTISVKAPPCPSRPHGRALPTLNMIDDPQWSPSTMKPPCASGANLPPARRCVRSRSIFVGSCVVWSVAMPWGLERLLVWSHGDPKELPCISCHAPCEASCLRREFDLPWRIDPRYAYQVECSGRPPVTCQLLGPIS
jgi:prolycopene isomerase